MADLTCVCCGANPEKTRDVWHEGDWAQACYPPCAESLKPMSVARETRSCKSCGADVTNQETYNGGDCFLCLPEDQKVLVAGDPIVRWIGRLAS